MPVEIGTEWDPAAHDYGDGHYLPASQDGRMMAGIMGLGALAALGAAGIGFFLTAESAMIVGAGGTWGSVYVINGTTYVGITAGQATLIELMASEGMTGAGAAILATFLKEAGVSVGTDLALSSAGALLALQAAEANQQSSWGIFFTSGL